MEILQSLTAPYENLNWFLPPDMVNSKRDLAPRTLINIISNLEFIVKIKFSNKIMVLKNGSKFSRNSAKGTLVNFHRSCFQVLD